MALVPVGWVLMSREKRGREDMARVPAKRRRGGTAHVVVIVALVVVVVVVVVRVRVRVGAFVRALAPT